MVQIRYKQAVEAVEKLSIRAMCKLPPEAVMLLECACDEEDESAARTHICTLYENVIRCGLENKPVCSEVSRAVLIVGEDLQVEGGLEAAAKEGLARAAAQGMPYSGDLEIRVMGQGSSMELIPICPRCEGACFACDLAAGPLEEQVIEFLISAIHMCPHTPCFPAFIGVGLGETEDEAIRLAQAASRRPADSVNEIHELEVLEIDALETLCAEEHFGSFSVLSVNIMAQGKIDYCAAYICCHALRHASTVF